MVLLAYRTFKQIHYMHSCTHSEASTAAGYGWNMSCGRVEQKEEYGGTEGGIWWNRRWNMVKQKVEYGGTEGGIWWNRRWNMEQIWFPMGKWNGYLEEKHGIVDQNME